MLLLEEKWQEAASLTLSLCPWERGRLNKGTPKLPLPWGEGWGERIQPLRGCRAG